MLQGDIYILQEKNKEARKSYEMAMKHGWFALKAREKIKYLEHSNKDLEPWVTFSSIEIFDTKT